MEGKRMKSYIDGTIIYAIVIVTVALIPAIGLLLEYMK